MLVITGGLLTEAEGSVLRALRKQVGQWAASEHAWLDFTVKLVVAEPLLEAKLARRNRTVDEYFRNTGDLVSPDLTEVVLATLLDRQGIPYEVATYSDLFAEPKRLDRLLDETTCVFASTTFLRDLSEVRPLVRRLKRPHNRIVLGGPLAGVLGERGEGLEHVDVLAAGYGEYLVPALAGWIRSGCTVLQPPEGGRLVSGRTPVLYSGTPPGQDLDSLPSPDWSGRGRRMIYYESVRGCPYRCNFCNYPYLFADNRFRYKSARKMLEEWEHYRETLGVEYVICLDSLFTMPRRRLVEFCKSLIERKLGIRWVCYARADDLADEGIAALMKDAGAIQAQIGLESGDQRLLDNMDKACTVEANARAVDNCRKHGITSVVSLIVGFPGETEETLENTYRFLKEHPPDFYFLATFSTRATEVPVLNEMNRRRFGLETVAGLSTAAPYWRHRTMSCSEAGNHVRRMHARLMSERISLNAAVFYGGMLRYRPEQREALLAYQQRHRLRRAFDWVNRFVDWRLRRDMEQCFAGTTGAEALLDIQ